MATSDWPQTSTAPLPAQADIVVVGAGIAGLTTAYLLQREGRSVLVLDDGPIGDGETSRTTAHLANAIDDRFTEMERIHGPEGSRLAAESHGAAIDRIESIARDEGVDCDFVRLDGYLFLAEVCPVSLIDDELSAAHRAGLTGVERVEGVPFSTAAGAIAGTPALRFPRQGRFHPLKYLSGLARGIEQRGGRIATGIHVTSIDSGNPAVLHLGGGASLRAETVVVATNSPISERFALHTKQAPYRTYAIGAKVPRGSVTDALYWDTLDIYHYVRLQPLDDSHDLLIVGGEDHKTGEAQDMDQRYARLEEWTRKLFPMAGAVEHRWSGQVLEPYDGLAFIGRDPEGGGNFYVATGDSGMGMTHGTIAGMLITDLIQGRENPWAALYDPTRKQTKSLGEFLRENLDVAKQYTDYVKPGDVGSIDEIRPGTGAIIREGVRPVAAYRSEDGTVHRLSAICPHLKCVVHWNPGEKTWDCPCHGSRFSAEGTLLNGPSPVDLERLE